MIQGRASAAALISDSALLTIAFALRDASPGESAKTTIFTVRATVLK
jgi:hypothetical protein